MGSPTKEEYEEALKRKSYLIDAGRRERKFREDLINKLCTSQSCLSSYESLLNDVEMIIHKYEIWQELSKNYK